MNKENLIKLIDQFESAVSAAWIYDTKLNCQDDYISNKQLASCDELHSKYRNIRMQIMAEIENTDA